MKGAQISFFHAVQTGSKSQKNLLNQISSLGLYPGLKQPGREIYLSRKSNVKVSYVTLHLAVMLFMADFNIIFSKCRLEEEIIRLTRLSTD